jgi:alcohol dehydrogenase (cytochrome c)/quinohemoprotein ethanol dehydrogenase
MDAATSEQTLDTSIKGALLAWDPIAQREAWRVAYRTVSNGGTLTTGGNLVFQGTSDGRFHAYAADTGKEIWSIEVQNAILGGPITYELDAEQYVVALAGLGGTTPLVSGHLFSDFPRGQRGRLLAFKLGGKQQLPALPARKPSSPLDASQAKANGHPLLGARRYNEYCVSCHGTGAVSGPLMPDLRYSPTILDGSMFRSIVIDGARRRNGMAGFASSLTPADAEAIRAYLLWEATDLQQRPPQADVSCQEPSGTPVCKGALTGDAR